MTIGELISFNRGMNCDSIRVIYNNELVLKDTRMFVLHHAWYSLEIDDYYVYPDEDNYTSVTFTVYIKEV